MENFIINIDSSLSEESKKSLVSTDFNFQLPEVINNVTTLKMSSIELPNTSYLITTVKDNFYFYLNFNNEEHLIEINEGNYLPVDLQVIIEKNQRNR